MEDEFAKMVLEAIQKDGKVKTAILDLVCACPNVVTERPLTSTWLRQMFARTLPARNTLAGLFDCWDIGGLLVQGSAGQTVGHAADARGWGGSPVIDGGYWSLRLP